MLHNTISKFYCTAYSPTLEACFHYNDCLPDCHCRATFNVHMYDLQCVYMLFWLQAAPCPVSKLPAAKYHHLANLPRVCCAADWLCHTEMNRLHLCLQNCAFLTITCRNIHTYQRYLAIALIIILHPFSKSGRKVLKGISWMISSCGSVVQMAVGYSMWSHQIKTF